MKTVKGTNPALKKVLKLLFIVLAGLVVVTALLICLFFGYMTYKAHQDKAKEEKIDVKFHQEVSQTPSIQVKSFKLWEGDSIVELEVKNKGTVMMWYGLDGTPRLDRIGNFSTSYDCFNVDNQGNKKSYAFTTGLILDKDSAFQKWFPFEVNNLNDLVLRYDDIIKILETFPKNPSKVEHKDSWGTREVVGQSNNDFVVRPDKNKSNVACDLFSQSAY
jgi:hypothetical protein